eukprot:CAMPEP_0174238034 /NCGR_PEP_ID=MMETSP0417-20130205/10104_1 /TAXON_ID=242541 /ORGANISM="Mayorella sp, Strain BSH-02190019" /LENGTH=94 /DNA_ID=CAMNT_0015316839 /DNA_START=51 /DNA_END=335 /DNA_ORIENTATION=+
MATLQSLQEKMRARLGLCGPSAPPATEPQDVPPMASNEIEFSVCSGCRRCDEFTAGQGKNRHLCTNCGCDMLHHVDDGEDQEDEEEDEEDEEDY